MTEPVPDPNYGDIWEYKGVNYRVLRLSNELIQNDEGIWEQTLKYTTERWSGKTFNRGWSEFTRKFSLVSEPKEKKKSLKINALELQVLMGMDENTHPRDKWEGGDFYYTFKSIQGYSGIPMEKVRRTVRSLARKGFMEFRRGLMTEDQEAAGSGYRITEEGRLYVEKCTKTRQLSS